MKKQKKNVGIKNMQLYGLFLSMFSFALSSSATQSAPNILVVMTDDQGVGDVGYNNPLVKTPSIDRLAKQGAVFTDFTSCPICAPARASFVTGRNYMSAGTWGVGAYSFIREDETLLPEYLHRAGYRTAHFGKWDAGWTPDQRAYLRGYDVAGMTGGYVHKNPSIALNGVEKKFAGWTVDVLADLTIDFVREQTTAGKPWFAVTAYISPHGPWECASEYSDPLEAKGYSKSLATLYGMIQQMDTATGRILAELDNLGITDNTIVVYLSDNGATPCVNKELSTPPDSEDWVLRNPFGLAGHKSDPWQRGIQVPFLVRWPDHILPGERNQLCAMEDVLPTLLDLAGVSPSIVPDHLALDGASFKPVLLNPDAPDTDRLVFRMPCGVGAPGYIQGLGKTGIINDPDHDERLEYDRVRTVLRGPRFKYFHFERWFSGDDTYNPGFDFKAHKDGKYALFDIGADSSETNDVAESYPEITEEMAKDCQAKWEDLIAGQRCFRMPVFLIGDPRYTGIKRVLGYAGANEIAGNMPQKVFGSVKSLPRCTGFTEEGDAAVFAIDVRTAGRYRVSLKGKNVHACAPLTIEVAGKTLRPQEITTGEIMFGSTELSLGVTNLTVLAGAPESSVTSAVIGTITLEPEEPQEQLLAGFENWGSDKTRLVQEQPVSASSVYAGLIATVSNTVHFYPTPADRGCSDGDYGTRGGASTAFSDVGSAAQAGIANKEASMDFVVQNNTGSSVDLAGFNFDVYRSWSATVGADWTLAVVSGGITAGTVQSGTLDPVGAVNASGVDFPDVNVRLTGLSDHVLDAGETVSFRLTFSAGTSASNLYVDNVGVTGSIN